MLYGRNIFRFWDCGRITNISRKFIQLIGSRGTNLRNITIDCGAESDNGRAVANYLSNLGLLAAKLKTIELHFGMKWRDSYASYDDILDQFRETNSLIRSLITVEKMEIGPSVPWQRMCRLHPDEPTFEKSLEPDLKRGLFELGWTVAD